MKSNSTVGCLEFLITKMLSISTSMTALLLSVPFEPMNKHGDGYLA